MKYLWISLLLVTLSHADETQRIESIVRDITELRTDYGKCMSELKRYKNAPKETKVQDCSKYKKESKKYKALVAKYKKLLAKAKKENKALKQKVSEYAQSESEAPSANLPTDVKTLQREVKKYKLLLKIRDKKIRQLRGGSSAVSTPAPSVKQSTNKIPALVMKDKYQKQTPSSTNMPKPKKVTKLTNKIETFKASSFRLKVDSDIYDAPSANVVAGWKKNRSFTSNQKLNGWIKITGYFVNKKWRSAKKELWIDEANVIKR